MISYVIKAYTTVLAVYITYFFYSILSLNYDSILFIDTLSRINFNLSYWDLLYFLWTNLFYIYAYFLPLLFCYYWFLQRYYRTTYYISIIALVSFTSAYFALLNLNLNLQGFSNFLASSSNLLLTNNINKYHPLMLHLSLNFILVICLNSSELFFKAKHYYLTFSFFSITLLIFSICYITMILGSWWAYQEGSWGGWWAWDPSEMLGLLILISLTLTFHLSFFWKRISKVNRILKLYFIVVYLTYFCLQSNFSITSHNFGFQSESSIFLKIYYYTLILIFFTYLFIWLLKEFNLSLLLWAKKCLTNLSFKYYTQFTSIVILISLLPLLTDLLWKILTINFVNLSANYYALLLSLILLIVLMFKSDTKFNILEITIISFLTVINSNIFLVFAAIALKSRKSIFYLIHITILISTILSIISSKYYYSDWIHNYANISLTYSCEFDYFNNVFSSHYPYFSSSLSLKTIDSSLVLFALSTVSEMPMFNLLLVKLDVIQEFISDNGRLKFSTISIDSFSIYILILAVSLFLVMTAEKLKCYKIKC